MIQEFRYAHSCTLNHITSMLLGLAKNKRKVFISPIPGNMGWEIDHNLIITTQISDQIGDVLEKEFKNDAG